MGIVGRRVRGLVLGDFARVQWFRLSTRTLATVLEPNLHMGLVSTRNWGLDGLRYLYLLLPQRDATHDVHTSGLVWFRVLRVGFLENFLVIGTISGLVGLHVLEMV